MHDDGRYGDDAADGQASGVAHEDLGREGVEPQETDEGADEGGHEDHQFFAAWDVHQVQVARCDRVTGDIGQQQQGQSDDGGVARCHAVHAVVEVGAIADGSHDEDGEKHEEHPCQVVHPLLARPFEQVGIVEVVAFHEGDGGTCRLHVGALLHYLGVVLDLHLHFFVDLHGRTET